MQIEDPKTPEEIIIKASACHFGLDVVDFTETKDTSHNLSYQRGLCLLIIKDRTFISYKKAAFFFGMPESTGKTSVYKIRNAMTVNRRITADFKEIIILIDKFTERKKMAI